MSGSSFGRGEFTDEWVNAAEQAAQQRMRMINQLEGGFEGNIEGRTPWTALNKNSPSRKMIERLMPQPNTMAPDVLSEHPRFGRAGRVLPGVAGGMGLGLLLSAIMPEQAYAAGEPIRGRLKPAQDWINSLPPTQVEHALLDPLYRRMGPVHSAFQKSWNTLGGYGSDLLSRLAEIPYTSDAGMR
jgi:hypothetical protein